MMCMKRLRLLTLASGVCWLASCANRHEAMRSQPRIDSFPALGSAGTSQPVERSGASTLREATDGLDVKDAQFRERYGLVWVSEESPRAPTPSEWHLPNYEMGPGRPEPKYRNFYIMDDLFPGYLLCRYPVDEATYDSSREPFWFKSALQQVRRLGPKKFPPVGWVAVCICNVAEHKDAATYEQSHKVGAIFKASNVFGHQGLARVVAERHVDRHPFQYVEQSTTRMPQRWLVVERHAATNHTVSGSIKR